MEKVFFEVSLPVTGEWLLIPDVNEAQMREVDRIAVEEFQIGILQMMENAGRNLAILAYRFLQNQPPSDQPKKILVVAGSGGNGGGGLCAARHLHNQGAEVHLVLTKEMEEFSGAALAQLAILRTAGLAPVRIGEAEKTISEVELVLDAIIGYSLKGAPKAYAKRLIELINRSGKPVISLDMPSGMDATSGETPGVCVRADQTLCLALPKPGLANPLSGELFLADIGLPPEVYAPLGIRFVPFFGSHYILPMRSIDTKLK